MSARALGLVGLVARREIATRIRERGFQLGVVITLLILVGVIVLPAGVRRPQQRLQGRPAGQRDPVAARPDQAAKASDVTLELSVVGSEDAARRQGVAVFAVIFLYGQLFGYAMWVALGVVEEKASRVIELLLATVRPWQVLAGKVAGIGLLGLAQFVLLGAAGLAAALGTGRLSVPGEAVGTLLHVLVWFLLGYLFYACLAAAIAARVSRQEDLQNATGPMQVLLIGSFLIAIYAGQHQTGRLAGVLSFVPPFSAMVMPPRVAAGGVGPGQVLLAVLAMLAATAALVRLAAWVCTGAVLRTGAAVRLAEALRSGRKQRVAG